LSLRLVERALAIHELKQKVFLLLEPIIAHADRIFDHIVGAPFVLLRHDLDVLAQPDSNESAALQDFVACRLLHGFLGYATIVAVVPGTSRPSLFSTSAQ